LLPHCDFEVLGYPYAANIVPGLHFNLAKVRPLSPQPMRSQTSKKAQGNSGVLTGLNSPTRFKAGQSLSILHPFLLHTKITLSRCKPPFGFIAAFVLAQPRCDGFVESDRSALAPPNDNKEDKQRSTPIGKLSLLIFGQDSQYSTIANKISI